MKNLTLRIMVLPLLLLLNCTPETPTPPEPPANPSKLEIVWQTPMGSDSLDYFSIQPLFFNDKVVFSQADFRQNKEVLRAFDRYTGAPAWNWEPVFAPDFIPSMNGTAQAGGKIAVSYFQEVYLVDAGTGQTVWAHQMPPNGSGWPRITRIGDRIFHQHHNKIVKDTIAHLVASPLDLLRWDTIFTLREQNGYRPSFEMPALWTDPAGDSILIFQNRQWNFPQSDGRIDLHALNLRTRSLVWSAPDIDPDGNSNVAPPSIYQNRVYFMGQSTLYCLDAFHGNILWKRVFANDNLLVTNILIAEDKLFIKPSNDGILYAIDLATGQNVYTVAQTGTAHVNMQYFDGIIYYCDAGKGRLHAIRAADGKVIWDEYSPNFYQGKTAGEALMLNHLTIDPDQRMLFTNDSYYYLCIKLPE